MTNLELTVRRQAEAHGIHLEKPLRRADQKRLLAALKAEGVDATPAQLSAAREAILADVTAVTETVGGRTRASRAASAGSTNSTLPVSATVAVRAGTANEFLPLRGRNHQNIPRPQAEEFDAAGALKAAVARELAAGGLQWTDAQVGGRRWIPATEVLAKMERRTLASIFGGSPDIIAFWPKSAGARGVGATIYLERKQPSGAQYAALNLRQVAANNAASNAPTQNPAQVSGGRARDVLRAAGLSARPVVRSDNTVALYLMTGFDAARAALKAAGFAEEPLRDRASGLDVKVYRDAQTSVVMRLVKDEASL